MKKKFFSIFFRFFGGFRTTRYHCAVVVEKVATAPSLLKHVESEQSDHKIEEDLLSKKNKDGKTFKEYLHQQDLALKNAAQVLTAVQEVKEAIKDHDIGENQFIKSIFTLQKPDKIVPFDVTRGEPKDINVKLKRDKIVEMTKHAWDSYALIFRKIFKTYILLKIISF